MIVVWVQAVLWVFSLPESPAETDWRNVQAAWTPSWFFFEFIVHMNTSGRGLLSYSGVPVSSVSINNKSKTVTPETHVVGG